MPAATRGGLPKPFPDFIMALPVLDLPFPEDVVQARAIRSEAGLTVFFTFLENMTLPPLAHGAGVRCAGLKGAHRRAGGRPDDARRASPLIPRG
jgi:hypothetical protein